LDEQCSRSFERLKQLELKWSRMMKVVIGDKIGLKGLNKLHMTEVVELMRTVGISTSTVHLCFCTGERRIQKMKDSVLRNNHWQNVRRFRRRAMSRGKICKQGAAKAAVQD